MPILSNSRWERFCQELAKGSAKSHAYKAAGYISTGNAAEVCANRLLRKAPVSARVAELKQLGAARAEISRKTLIQRLDRVFERACELKQMSAAVSAVKEIGILSGERVEKQERGVPGEYDRLAQMSHAELVEYVTRQLTELGLEIAASEDDIGQDAPMALVSGGRP
jgi:hypothetical protein